MKIRKSIVAIGALIFLAYLFNHGCQMVYDPAGSSDGFTLMIVNYAREIK